MKKLIYIVCASVIILTGCSDDFELNDNDQNLNVQLLNGEYVAYSASGANTTTPPISAKEGDTGIALNVEIPTGTESDVTVNFEFDGTAVYGVDFTVPGGSSAGGSVVVVPDDGSGPANVIDNVDIVVDLLTDDNQDGNKTLVITLSSASNAQGAVNVGRGGTDILKSQTISIADVDCGDVAGLYDVTGTILVDDFGSGPYAYTDRIALSDCTVEGKYGRVIMAAPSEIKAESPDECFIKDLICLIVRLHYKSIQFSFPMKPKPSLPIWISIIIHRNFFTCLDFR